MHGHYFSSSLVHIIFIIIPREFFESALADDISLEYNRKSPLQDSYQYYSYSQ